MTTQKQIEANRRNAKKSTGPRTLEGKARSAQNATRHGLLSRRVVLADEDEAQFKELRINLYEDLAPEGQLEGLLVNRIAAQQWRLARIPALEAELLDSLRDDLVQGDLGLGGAWAKDSEPYGGALMRLARYETMLERSVARLLAELRRLQAARRRRDGESQARWAQERDARWRESPLGAGGVAPDSREGEAPLHDAGWGGIAVEPAPFPSEADGRCARPGTSTRSPLAGNGRNGLERVFSVPLRGSREGT